MTQSTIDTVNIAEERLRQAMLASDIEELRELLADDLIFTNHLGMLTSKQDDIQMHASGDIKIGEIHLSDQKTLLLDETAIVTAKVTIIGSYQGQAANGIYRFTRVWHMSPESNWQVIAGHSCVIA